MAVVNQVLDKAVARKQVQHVWAADAKPGNNQIRQRVGSLSLRAVAQEARYSPLPDHLMGVTAIGGAAGLTTNESITA